MERVYKTSILLTTNNCDVSGRWKPSAIMDAMQEAAGRHGEMLGFGRKELAPMGIVWVVTRLEVVMDRYPLIGETVELETFPTSLRRWFCPRYYTFRDEQGNIIGRAGTLWLLMDSRSRRMANPDAIRHLLPDNSDLPTPLGLPAPVTEVSGLCVSGDYVPVYSDLDVNGHVNNTRYMDMCCNALGIDALKDHVISHFIINFDRQILPHETVSTELRCMNDEFSFIGRIGENKSFEVGGNLSR